MGNVETESKSLEVHPAADLFPMMPADELNSLAEDIKTNGLIEPIVLYEGKILDGRNRLAACAIAGAEPCFADATLNGTSATLFVVSKNLHRRHLTTSQRAAIGAEMLPILREEAKKRMREGGRNGGHLSGRWHQGTAKMPDPDSRVENDLRGESRSIAAKAVLAGGKTIQMAAAVKDRDPQLFERIRHGEIGVHAAYDKVIGGTAPKKQVAITSEKLKTRRGETAKRRMIEGLSHIRGLCRGLSELNGSLLTATLTEKDCRTWAGIANEASRQLREFARRLRAES